MDLSNKQLREVAKMVGVSGQGTNDEIAHRIKDGALPGVIESAVAKVQGAKAQEVPAPAPETPASAEAELTQAQRAEIQAKHAGAARALLQKQAKAIRVAQAAPFRPLDGRRRAKEAAGILSRMVDMSAPHKAMALAAAATLLGFDYRTEVKEFEAYIAEQGLG